jgi:hypothetical protein
LVIMQGGFILDICHFMLWSTLVCHI